MAHKFTLQLGGQQRAARLDVPAVKAYERLTGRGFIGGFNPDSVTDLSCFLLATLRAENPAVSMAQVEAWIEQQIAGPAFLILQVAVMEAVNSWRGIQIPASELAALREQIAKGPQPVAGPGGPGDAPQLMRGPGEAGDGGAPAENASASGAAGGQAVEPASEGEGRTAASPPVN